MPSGHRVNEAETRLREWLENTAPARGTRLPSERALAVQFGLRHYALNRAMGRLISEGLVERDGYKLFAAGAAPARTAFTCHLVVAQRSIYLPGYRKIAKEMGIKLVLHTWESSDEAIVMLGKLDHRETEAVVFDPPYASHPSLWEPAANRLNKHGIPVVCIGQTAPGISSVQVDSFRSLQIALQHLTELGHREIGLITHPTINPLGGEVIQSWDDLCRLGKLTQSARRIHLKNHLRLKEDVNEVAELLAGDWKTTTALVVFPPPDCNLQLLQEQLIQKGRSIPGDLALIFIGDSKQAATAVPPVSSVSVDMGAVQETAFYLAQRAARKKKSPGILLPSCDLRLQPQLFARASTRKEGPAAAPPQDRPDSARTPARPKPSADATALAESAIKKTYSLAARAFLSERPRFSPVDLGRFVNRPLNFRRGWLGDLPLKHLAPGRHEIHGVPFEILGGPKRSDCGTIVFHSAVNTTGSSQKLPDTLKIPIGSKAQAVYILHGCGYARFLHTFAHYEFRSRTACLGHVPVVSLGQPPPGYNPAQPPPKTAAPNIQDWWPDYPHTDFPHARMAPILESDNTGHDTRHVFLYTLEWINPSPQTVVNHLEITVDPTHSTTLGVLAVTVLKP